MELVEAWIPMPDGIRLSVDLYMPTGGEEGERFPVLLEYEPYRKVESRSGLWRANRYFVERGYAVAWVDIRGTGSSEGRTIPYEYSDIEHDDGEVVIDWLSKQDWSNGNVGMFGLSWGGFNSIQMAMRNPPALKTIIAMMATEELFQEDVHYMDGIMHTDSWMLSHDLYNSMPAAPDFNLDQDWFENRFDVEPSVFTYMRNQRDGPFWDRASARDKYDRIRIPTMHIAGWYDGYRNSVPRMLENLQAPVKAIIGPWDHTSPHASWPEPSVEWRHEAIRWLDHWLKGRDTGVLDEPSLAVYVRDWHPPGPGVNEVAGKWRWEAGWPIERTRWKTLFAGPGSKLSKAPSEAKVQRLEYKASVGLEGGGPVAWWGNIPPDQQPMDDHSLVYDSAPLEEDLEILGRPRAHLVVSADAPRANWFVRISDVAPDGSVTQVSGIGFNGTHRISARQPRDLVPGETFTLDLELMLTSWTFPKGHRIRMAVSNAQWPMFWPTPHRMTSTLALGGEDGSRIELPVIPAGGLGTPVFPEPVTAPGLDGFESLDSGNVSGYGEIYQIDRDPESGEAWGEMSNSGRYRYPWSIESFEESLEHRTSDTHPEKTSISGTYALTQELADRTLRFEHELSFSSDLENFHLVIKRRVLEDGEVLHEKTWSEAIPRDFQ